MDHRGRGDRSKGHRWEIKGSQVEDQRSRGESSKVEDLKVEVKSPRYETTTIRGGLETGLTNPVVSVNAVIWSVEVSYLCCSSAIPPSTEEAP